MASVLQPAGIARARGRRDRGTCSHGDRLRRGKAAGDNFGARRVDVGGQTFGQSEGTKEGDEGGKGGEHWNVLGLGGELGDLDGE